MLTIYVHRMIDRNSWSVTLGIEKVAETADEATAIVGAQRKARKLAQGHDHVQILHADTGVRVPF